MNGIRSQSKSGLPADFGSPWHIERQSEGTEDECVLLFVDGKHFRSFPSTFESTAEELRADLERLQLRGAAAERYAALALGEIEPTAREEALADSV